MLKGYVGKILFVDLSTKKISEEKLDESLCRDYIGGYGFGVKYLYDNIKPGIDPLGPDNIMGFLTGPLTGTGALVAPRFMVVGKSPLTGGWGDSNCGGYFGPVMKRAGYDGVYVSGVSDTPVYLVIDGGKAEIKDASALWGLDTFETDDALKELHGKKAESLSIGPAGEKCSLLSAMITNQGNASARSGLAAVMGSKKLKAIVVKGTQEIPVHDKEGFKELRKKELPVLLENGLAGILREFGTACFIEGSVESGDAPIKNWGGAWTTDYPNYKNIDGNAIKEILHKKKPCHACPIACHRTVNLKEENGEERVVGTAEYETLGSFGTLCLNDNLESILRCNEICNRYGLDTISAGAAVAFAIECFEKGIITTDDTDGLELKWGDHEAIEELTLKMAKREGFGALLADGTKVAAEKLGKGAMDYAMQIGGQELAMHDQRLLPGLLATYWTDATPGRHTQGCENFPIAGIDLGPYDPDVQEGRGMAHKITADAVHIFDSFGMCLFGYFCMELNPMIEFANKVIGWDMDFPELLEVGERISNLRHAFNLREGINFMNFYVPKRLLGQPPLKEGPLAGVSLDEKVLLGDYIRAMEWDEKSLIPSKEKLNSLGLAHVIDDLYN